MAQSQTCAQRTLLRIGTIRGHLAFLGQPEPGMLSTILSRFAVQYRITPNAMTGVRPLQKATAEDCASTLVRNLERLTDDAGFIKGINHVDAAIVNSHLHVLAMECRSFALAQHVAPVLSARIDAALRRFAAREIDGRYAGSARPAPSTLMESLRREGAAGR
jgi:hypothetical protein